MQNVIKPPPVLGGALNRRRFVQGLTAGMATAASGLSLASSSLSSTSQRHGLSSSQSQVLTGTTFNLNVGYLPVNFTGRERQATAVNGSVPAPVLRWKEGETVTINVSNQLAHDTSIHWHGMILPAAMDGVPGLSTGFSGIKPGETFQYQFPVKQNGT